MIITVCSVLMDKLGVQQKNSVFVDKELSGMAIFVLLFKNVMEDQFGIRTHGHVNVLQRQFGMEDFVFKIPVQEDKFGITIRNNVYVLEDRF